MDITQLRYFLKTAELLNYTHAAAQLYITRQSLRQAIAAMEKELGQPLFINERNKLSLTECGAYLAVAGEKVVRAFDSMNEGLLRLSDRQTHLRIAHSVSLFPFILPGADEALRTFRAKFPRIRLENEIMENDEIIDAVEAGRLDCGCIIQMPCRREHSTMRCIAAFDAAIDFSDGSPLCGKESVTLRDLEGIPCIGMGSLNKTMYPVFDACRTEGIHLDYTPTISTIDAFYHVQHGHAAAFDIYKPDAPGFDPLHTARLPGFSWEIGFLCSESCADKNALELLCAFLRQAYDRMNAPQGH